MHCMFNEHCSFSSCSVMPFSSPRFHVSTDASIVLVIGTFFFETDSIFNILFNTFSFRQHGKCDIKNFQRKSFPNYFEILSMRSTFCSINLKSRDLAMSSKRDLKANIWLFSIVWLSRSISLLPLSRPTHNLLMTANFEYSTSLRNFFCQSKS